MGECLLKVLPKRLQESLVILSLKHVCLCVGVGGSVLVAVEERKEEKVKSEKMIIRTANFFSTNKQDQPSSHLIKFGSVLSHPIRPYLFYMGWIELEEDIIRHHKGCPNDIGLPEENSCPGGCRAAVMPSFQTHQKRQKNHRHGPHVRVIQIHREEIHGK